MSYPAGKSWAMAEDARFALEISGCPRLPRAAKKELKDSYLRLIFAIAVERAKERGQVVTKRARREFDRFYVKRLRVRCVREAQPHRVERTDSATTTDDVATKTSEADQ